MRKENFKVINYVCVILLILSFTACNGVKPPPKKEGIIAIVFADLTGSINEETANKLKTNVKELFNNLPPQSKFYLYSIDKGTSKPPIFEYVPVLPPIESAADEYTANKKIEELGLRKANEESARLQNALNVYYDSISKQKGAVSCLTNKLNILGDSVTNKSISYPNHELRIYFYSDMIEDCENSFDGKPLNFERKPNDLQEQAHADEINTRIEKNVSQLKKIRDLETKIHIILTSHDDKQELSKLKSIWAKLFNKFGYQLEDFNNDKYFYWDTANNKIIWEPRIESQ